MNSVEKMVYTAPELLVVEVKIQGVICGSDDMPQGRGNGFPGWY